MSQTSIIIRVEIKHSLVSFGEVASLISDNGGDVTSIDMIYSEKEMSIRDITVNLPESSEKQVVSSLSSREGIHLINVSDRTFLAHLGGKISIRPTLRIKTRDDLSRVYTPGVARVCAAIHENPNKAFSLTIKRNTVAVVSDGTAVLGLGDIGPYAAAPVMEGKAMLFKQLG